MAHDDLIRFDRVVTWTVSQVDPVARNTAIDEQAFTVRVEHRSMHNAKGPLFEWHGTVSVQVAHGANVANVGVHTSGKPLHDVHLTPTLPSPAGMEGVGQHAGHQQGAVKGFGKAFWKRRIGHPSR